MEPHRRLQVSLYDPDALRAVISHAAFDLRVLDGGSFVLDHDHIDLGGVSIDSGRQNRPILAHGALPGDCLTVGMVMDHGPPFTINGRLVDHAGVQLYAPGSELLYRSREASSWAAVQVRLDDLHAAAAELGAGTMALPGRGMLHQPVAPEGADALRAAITGCVVAARAGRIDDGLEKVRWSARLLRCLVEMLADPRRPQAEPGAAAGARTVWRALAVMRDHLQDELDLDRLSRLVGMSGRSLQLACRSTIGLTPLQLLRLERLARARSDLLRRADPVTEVALRNGFSHLGRFSIEYRRLYGERPRDTRVALQRGHASG